MKEFGSHRILASMVLLFPLVLLVSVGFAAVYSGWEIALESLVRVLLLGVSVYVFLYTWVGPRGDTSDSFAFTRLLFGLGLAGALFACVDFYFQLPAPAGYGEQFIRLEKGVFRRAQGVFYESSTLGNFCAFFLVMILVAAFTRKERDRRPVVSRGMLLIGALIFATALILSLSRGSVVTVIVASVVFLCMHRATARRVLLTTVVAVAIVAGALRLALPDFSAHYWRRSITSIQQFGSVPDAVLSGRLTHWGVLADFIIQHPWHIIFGIGYKTLPYTNYLGASLIADNTYLSLLVETGVVGLAVFLLWNVAILRVAYCSARSKSPGASFFGLWIFCFWCGELVQMLSGDLITYWRVLPLYFWVLAAALRESASSSRAGLD
jgi:O-antigen ligase